MRVEIPNWIRFSRNQLSIDIGYLTVALFWPSLYFGKKEWGFLAKTMLLIRKYDWEKEGKFWPWQYAFCALLMGFGVDGTYKHVDNYLVKRLW